VHELIRTRDASLVTRGSDVLELVSPTGDHLPVARRGEDRPQDHLNALEQQVLDGVPASRPAPTSSVARTAGVGETAAAQVLAGLQLGGFVEALSGGWRLGPVMRPPGGASSAEAAVGERGP
jgi:DNA processing protein